MINLLSPLQKIHTMDFKLSTIYTNPSSTTVLVDGSWWQLDPANPNHIIPTDHAITTAGWTFPMWSKTGESSTQALGQATVLAVGNFVAETDQFQAGAYAPGDILDSDGGVLIPFASNAVAIVILDPADNNGLLRFVRL